MNIPVMAGKLVLAGKPIDPAIFAPKHRAGKDFGIQAMHGSIMVSEVGLALRNKVAVVLCTRKT